MHVDGQGVGQPRWAGGAQENAPVLAGDRSIVARGGISAGYTGPK